MELDSTLRKVRALIAKAEHANTSPEEAAAASAMADKIMLRYAITEAQLEADKPEEQRGGPAVILIDTASDDMTGYANSIAISCAMNARCRVRNYARWNYDTQMWQSKVYGFKSDLAYFEILYTTIRLHMVGAFSPRWDDTEGFDENVYRLHKAGLNWLDIARLIGWEPAWKWNYPDIKSPYRNSKTHEVVSGTSVAATFKRAYLKQREINGDTDTVKIPPRGSKIYRDSAMWGYTSRITQRLSEARKAADEEPGAGALVLRHDDLDAFYRDDNPDLYEERKKEDPPPQRKRRERKYVEPPFNQTAYEAGVRHADTADLGGHKFASKTEIG
jgi:hypothetical protein